MFFKFSGEGASPLPTPTPFISFVLKITMIKYANMYKYVKVFSVAITGTVYIVCIGDVFEFIFLVILLQKVCFVFFKLTNLN